MRPTTNGPGASSRASRFAVASTALAACGMLAGLACGGTTGREGLPTPVTVVDSGPDATLAPDASDKHFDAGAFDVVIVYADRLLPDVESPVLDAGSDSADDAAEGGGGLLPCTVANPTLCVQCQGNIPGDGGNEAGLCTPTEADFVAFDIANGIATVPGPDPGLPVVPPTPGPDAGTSDAAPSESGAAIPITGSCYYCLFQSGCLDDTLFEDTGHECEDGNIVNAGMTTAADCEAVIHCVLGSSCAKAAVSACYCGTAAIATSCQGNPAPGPINGACASLIAMGLGFPPADGTDITKNLDDFSKGGGRADQIFQCAQSNGCTACLQK